MADFVKLHNRDNGEPVLFNLDNVTSVSLYNGATCLFEVGNSRNPFVVLETIDEVTEIVSGTNISNDRRDIVSKLFDHGRITMNEARRLLDLEPWGANGDIKVPKESVVSQKTNVLKPTLDWTDYSPVSDLVDQMIEKARNDNGGNNSV